MDSKASARGKPSRKKDVLSRAVCSSSKLNSVLKALRRDGESGIRTPGTRQLNAKKFNKFKSESKLPPPPRKSLQENPAPRPRIPHLPSAFKRRNKPLANYISVTVASKINPNTVTKQRGSPPVVFSVPVTVCSGFAHERGIFWITRKRTIKMNKFRRIRHSARKSVRAGSGNDSLRSTGIDPFNPT